MTRFPIQGVGTVAWEAAEHAYRAYSARYGKDQSLERLAQRGGFGLAEFAMLYWTAAGHEQGGPWPRRGDELDWQNVARAVVWTVQQVDFEVEDTPGNKR